MSPPQRIATRTERALEALHDRLEEVDAKLDAMLAHVTRMDERDAWVDYYRDHSQDGLPEI